MSCFIILFCCLVPFKKQTLLKWKTTPPEGDTNPCVNECNVTSVVLNENELCEDEKPVNNKSMDSLKPNEIHEELSNDSKTETLSDITIPDQEIAEDNSVASQEDTTEDMERTSEPVSKLTCDSVVESVAASEKFLLSTDATLSTVQPQADVASISPPASPEPLVVDDSAALHECTSRDAGELRTEKISSDQSSDVKTSGGTDTPQQGKRKKVIVEDIFVYLFHIIYLSRFLCWSIETELARLLIIKS